MNKRDNEEGLSRAYSVLVKRLKGTLELCRSYEEQDGEFRPPESHIIREEGDPDSWFAIVSDQHMAELHVLHCFMGCDASDPEGPIKPCFSGVTLRIETLPTLIRSAEAVLSRSRVMLGPDGTSVNRPKLTPNPILEPAP